MGVYTSLRDSTFLWYLRVVQLLSSLAVAAVTVANVSDWHGMGCSIPDQLQINFAAASVSVPVILYLMLTTGIGRVEFLPWNALLQLIMDCTLLAVWAIPTSFPSYTCTIVCTNCNPFMDGEKQAASAKAATGFYVWLGKLTCSCHMPLSGDRGHVKHPAVTIRRNAYLRPGKNDPATKIFRGVSRIAAKRSLDLFMIGLLSIMIMSTAIAIYRKRSGLRRTSSLPMLFDVEDPTSSSKKTDEMVKVTTSPGSPAVPASSISDTSSL